MASDKYFTSNVVGKKFGRGRYPAAPWLCICEHLNKSYSVKCEMCNIDIELARQVRETYVE